jgi:cholest-4-en-3-one 26-monooxygenase
MHTSISTHQGHFCAKASCDIRPLVLSGRSPLLCGFMTSVSAPGIVHSRPTVDLLDPALYQRNPHDVWTWMRSNEPVYHDARNGLWAITRYDDVIDVERRSQVFASRGSYRALVSFDESNMIAQDDPTHRQQRMLVQRFFAPSVIARKEPEVREIVRTCINQVLANGSMEVVADVAAQLPARLTCRLIGFPEDWWDRLKVWSEKLMRTDMRERDGGIFLEFMGANMELLAVVEKIVEQKRADPKDDLLSVWATSELNGSPIPLHTIFHETGLFVAGGAETTRTAIAHGVRAFVDAPEQWDALAADPSLINTAVEEVLRWVTPLNNFFRRAMTPDATVGTTHIPMGDRVVMIYPSANRDEAQFADPFRFDITRSPNQHVAFGNGPHMCIGAPFARMTLRVVFEELSQSITSLRVRSEPDVEANIFARAVKKFELDFSAR